MKIYTKQGDDGKTALFGSGRVPKYNPRIEACGTIDEINSFLGLALASPHSDWAADIVNRIQNQLFVLGADVATPDDARQQINRIGPEEIAWLEETIDRTEEELAPLTHFILPGGCPAGAALHLARSVCRRAERGIVRSMETESISEQVLIYLNRLSDLLFVLARHENRKAGTKETIWSPRSSSK